MKKLIGMLSLVVAVLFLQAPQLFAEGRDPSYEIPYAGAIEPPIYSLAQQDLGSRVSQAKKKKKKKKKSGGKFKLKAPKNGSTGVLSRLSQFAQNEITSINSLVTQYLSNVQLGESAGFYGSDVTTAVTNRINAQQEQLVNELTRYGSSLQPARIQVRGAAEELLEAKKKKKKKKKSKNVPASGPFGKPISKIPSKNDDNALKNASIQIGLMDPFSGFGISFTNNLLSQFQNQLSLTDEELAALQDLTNQINAAFQKDIDAIVLTHTAINNQRYAKAKGNAFDLDNPPNGDYSGTAMDVVFGVNTTVEATLNLNRAANSAQASFTVTQDGQTPLTFSDTGTYIGNKIVFEKVTSIGTFDMTVDDRGRVKGSLTQLPTLLGVSAEEITFDGCADKETGVMNLTLRTKLPTFSSGGSAVTLLTLNQTS